MIAKYGLGEFKFSQSYSFFYDQLEKSNLFLQGIIDNAKKPMDDKLVSGFSRILFPTAVSSLELQTLFRNTELCLPT